MQASTRKIVTGDQPPIAALVPQQHILSQEGPAQPLPDVTHASIPTRHREIAPAGIATVQTNVHSLKALSMPAQRPTRPAKAVSLSTLERQSSVTPPRVGDAAEGYKQRSGVTRSAPIVVASAETVSPSFNAGPANLERRSIVASQPRVAAIYAPHPERITTPASPGS